MGEPSLGALSTTQRAYLAYINTSTNARRAIINDILDCATIDAGAMKLNLGLVDIRRTMSAAAEGIRDRLIKDNITLDIRSPSDIGSFPPGATITISAERRPDVVVFAVTDNGPGIPPEVQNRVFDWFESHSQGSSHRGAGLGISIVRSLVALHGGTVNIAS